MKLKMQESLIPEYNPNPYLESVHTLVEILKSHKFQTSTRWRFANKPVKEFIENYSFGHRALNFCKQNYNWVKHFGYFVIWASNDYLMQNKDSNYVFAEYRKANNLLNVYFNFPNSVARIGFTTVTEELAQHENPLLNFVNGDDEEEVEYIEIEIKRQMKGDVIFNVMYQNDNDLLTKYYDNHFCLTATQNHAIRCAHEMYDYVLKYCICTYFGVIDIPDEVTWKELLRHGLPIC